MNQGLPYLEQTRGSEFGVDWVKGILRTAFFKQTALEEGVSWCALHLAVIIRHIVYFFIGLVIAATYPQTL